MTKRIASLALALALTAPAAAFAQGFGDRGYGDRGFDAPRIDRTESRSFFGMPAWVDDARAGNVASREALTTGSITPLRNDVRTGRVAPQAGVFAQ